MKAFHAEYAWLGGEKAAREVLIEIGEDGRFVSVTPDSPVPDGTTRLPGLTLPGLANAHSHTFHRALRGRTHAERGTFWTWRDEMYAVAERLDPDSYGQLARAVFGEMALAGVTCVGEFHYVHHTPTGTPYEDPNAMGAALIVAAADVGIRITLLDSLYLTASVAGDPLTGPQQRFGDGTAEAWASRLADLADQPHAKIGVAIHSVRAVPPDAISIAVAAADGRPLHFHLSEQRAENFACQRVHGRTPTELLHDLGALGPNSVAIHATHLNDLDRSMLGDTDTGVCFCPTTERDLADGIGPARALVDGGSPLSLGSDSHAVIDLFEEARAVELNERLRTEQRGHFWAGELLTAASRAGHAALGWTDAGAIQPGQRADLVTIKLDSVRTAGTEPLGAAVFAATAADVTHVVVDGRDVVTDGRHVRLDVAGELARTIVAVTG